MSIGQVEVPVIKKDNVNVNKHSSEVFGRLSDRNRRCKIHVTDIGIRGTAPLPDRGND